MASTIQTAPETHTGIKLPVLEREKLILQRALLPLDHRAHLRGVGKQATAALVVAVHSVRADRGHRRGRRLVPPRLHRRRRLGQHQPVIWGWHITNFVFWIGIGHAGTLISAILFLTRQNWRTSINRAAEAMTIFAVMCAGIFPAFHVGRVWFAWFLAPVPNANAHLAELQVAAALGRVRGFHLLHRLADLLVSRHGARSRDHPRPLQAGPAQDPLRHLRARLARRQPPVEPLRDGLSAAGRALHAAGALGALGRVLRLRHLGGPRLAHHHLPALLRRGRHLRRLRDGAHHHDPGPVRSTACRT